MLGISLAFLVQNSLTAVIVVVYLFYEIHYGRLSALTHKINAMIIAIIALAKANERVDEEKVIESLNGSTPEDLLKKSFPDD